MDVPTQNSGCLSCQELNRAYSFKTCCCFVSVFITFIAIVSGVIILVIIFVLKPQEPRFSLNTVKVESYKLSARSSSTLFVSCLASLILNAQNHNKIGIKYTSSRLHIYHEGIPIGLVRIPGFYQPAHSDNVGVATQVSLPCINVTQIFEGSSSKEKARKNVVQMKLIGDIGLHLLLFHLTLPKIKVALECDIGFNYSELAFTNAFFAIKVVEDHIASFPVNSGSFTKNCSLALNI
ncbi:hypothetical protein Tsubulata_028094 [Turnera subulata]|uniref:Late embryogenesis abundant protein LEA-2 subgroup domain-containing protein n=1 Tax=Turnera subulata TaxID=218843 RepID=A0A9Q0FTH3_9ROSI|nr:hypothetical protein Tsubulata_028094 [Turnera subulata]